MKGWWKTAVRALQPAAVLAVSCILLLAIGAPVVRGDDPPTYADVLFVTAQQQDDGNWRMDVTVQHADTGWEHYADAWEVLSPDGDVLAKRVLTHPHVDEQPFTRSMSGIQVPADYMHVLVRAHDLVDGYGGREVIVALDRTSGPGFEVRRSSAATPVLAAHLVDAPPVIDGQVESVWEAVPPTTVLLTTRDNDASAATEATLRAVYDAQNLYLLARWPEPNPVPGTGDVNKLTVHWQIVPTFIHCSVACHTAYVDASSRSLRTVNAETIPQAGSEALPAAGAWNDGEWTLEWSRPLLSDNPYDLQFADLGIDYPFRVKVFEHQTDQPDPMSDTVLLRFQPAETGS